MQLFRRRTSENSVKHGSGNVMVWGFFTASGAGSSEVTDSTIHIMSKSP